MNFEIGTKLYICRKYHVFVFPTEKACSWPMREVVGAVFCLLTEPMDPDYANRYVAWLSSRLNCHVGWIASDVPWIVTEISAGRHPALSATGQHYSTAHCQHIRILSTDGKLGWINVAEWMEVRELAA